MNENFNWYCVEKLWNWVRFNSQGLHIAHVRNGLDRLFNLPSRHKAAVAAKGDTQEEGFQVDGQYFSRSLKCESTRHFYISKPYPKPNFSPNRNINAKLQRTLSSQFWTMKTSLSSIPFSHCHRATHDHLKNQNLVSNWGHYPKFSYVTYWKVLFENVRLLHSVVLQCLCT